jgi:hypothetical protein
MAPGYVASAVAPVSGRNVAKQVKKIFFSFKFYDFLLDSFWIRVYLGLHCTTKLITI